MADEADSDAYENVNDPVIIFSLRTTAPRRHTKAANRLLKYIEDRMSVDKITAQRHVVEEAYKEVVLLNERYKSQAVLTEEQLGATETWKGEVQDLYERCCNAVTEYPRPTDEDETNDNTMTVDAAKRRRLTLEYELEQSKIERGREIEDLKKQSQREQEDLKKQIEFQRKLENSIIPKLLANSTMTPQPDIETEELPRALWPKITLKPFNGNPRLWPDFIMSFNALVHQTRMPESYKLMALRKNLTTELKRRVANLFMGTSSYQAAIEGLKSRYGTIQVIMHAHIQQLSALPPFRSGDFKSLVTMASLVRDAVSSVEEDANPFAYSNVVSQLVKILPQELQREWGRYAHPLRPNMPTLGDFDKWIDGIVGAEEIIGNTSSATSQATRLTFSTTTKSPTAFRPTVMTAHVSKNFENHSSQSRKCQACQQDAGHGLEHCHTFQNMSPTVRAEICARSANCFRCLGRGHIAQECKKLMLCNITGCERRHHPLLHGAERVFPVRQVLLAFVPITIRVQGNRFRTLALLDPGSEATLITKSFAESVGLRGKPVNIELGTYRDSTSVKSEIVKFEIEAKNTSKDFVVEEGFIVPNIKLSSRKIDWPNVKQAWAHLANLDLPPIDSAGVNVLIGMDVTDAHVQLEVRTSEDGKDPGPRAVRTPFGWAVTGFVASTVMTGPTKKLRCLATQIAEYDIALVDLVEKFHSTESFGTQPTSTGITASPDETALRILERSIKFVNSRFQVSLLWKSEAVTLPNNRPIALRRFFSTERRLMSNQKMAESYTATIDKYVKLGYVHLVKVNELNGPTGCTWFLPHHGTINPNKPGKVRIVFDGSAKYGGVSLNDVQLRGPNRVANLVGVITRARESPYAVSADIEAMYHQVLVDPKDQAALCFLWRRPGSKTSPKTYQWARVPFGLNSSPASCMFVLQHTASTTPRHQDVERMVKENFYVDNYVDSYESEEKAITSAHRLINVLAQGGFRLNQWVSSSRFILESIPVSERSFQNST